MAPFRLPDALIVRLVNGIARCPDDPVAEGSVSLLDATTKLRLSGIVRTTKAGEFEVAAFAEQRVFVQVEGKDNGRTGYLESPALETRAGAPPEQLTVTVKPRVY